MKKFLFVLFLFALNHISGFAQYFIGIVTTTVNLRECASTECNILYKIPKNGNVFIFTDKEENGFYKVIYIDEDIEGYVSSRYIKLRQEVPINKNGTLQKIGQNTDLWPVISIENACDVRTTLRINNKTYFLEPHQTQDIVSEPGQATIIASSKGIIPYIGADVLENNSEYWWKFYVVTSRHPIQNDNSSPAYISNANKKYHKTPKCKYLEGIPTKTSIGNAQKRRLQPCEHCYDINK